MNELERRLTELGGEIAYPADAVASTTPSSRAPSAAPRRRPLAIAFAACSS